MRPPRSSSSSSNETNRRPAPPRRSMHKHKGRSLLGSGVREGVARSRVAAKDRSVLLAGQASGHAFRQRASCIPIGKRENKRRAAAGGDPPRPRARQHEPDETLLASCSGSLRSVTRARRSYAFAWIHTMLRTCTAAYAAGRRPVNRRLHCSQGWVHAIARILSSAPV